jgi:hypothetical protein
VARALFIGLTVVLLAGACVSVSSPSSAPTTASPSLGITTPAPVPTVTPAAATASPTQAVITAAPTPEPTSEPTAPPTVEPSPPATLEPTGSPTGEQGDLLFADDMDDESSGWGVGQSGAVSAQYVNGTLQLNVDAAGQAVWSIHLLPDGLGVAAIAGEFRPVSDGAFGPLCEGDNGSLYGVAVTSDRSLSFVAVENNQTRVLKTLEDLVNVPPVGGFLLGVECTGLSTGALRLVAVGSDGPLAVYQHNEGPQRFSGVAVYAQATNDSFTLDVDQAGAYGIAGSAQGMTSEGESLLTNVPGDLQSTCYESPSSNVATAVLHCILQVEGTGAELLQFESYASNDAMNAAYQEAVDQYGVESTGSCRSGPNETTWSIDNAVRGRVQCAPQQVGIRFDWTDDVLSILSTLIDFDSDYENTYNLWLDAGPVDSPI